MAMACASWFAVAAAAGASTTTAGQKYNVLYLIADDLRPDFLSAYGQEYMITPNTDKLAQTGLVFNNAYCQQAVCGPSRASFMTGRRPSRTRVLDNGGNFRTDGVDGSGKNGTHWVTCPEHFKNSGWTTLGGGKTFHPGHPPNFDEPTSWSQDMPYFPYSYYIQPNKSYPEHQPCPLNPYKNAQTCASGIDTFCPVDEIDDHFYDFTLANNTVERLRYVAKRPGPWFLQSGFARPHAPWRVPQRFWDMYNTSNVGLPEHRYPPDGMPGIAWHQQGFYVADGVVHCPEITQPLDDATTLAMRHAYQASVTWLDHQIGTVLDELDALGHTDDTLVVLHGDHGWQLGEHNSWHKFTNFELGTRVPLIMRAPWMPKSVGQRSTIMAELIDIFPTIAELSGTPTPTDDLDGVSLAPVFDDPSVTTIPTNKGTRDKAVAYSQFPHNDWFNCTFFVGDTKMCSSKPPSSVTRSGDGSDGDVAAPASQMYMGYAVRDKTWRYVVWLPFDTKTLETNWSSPPYHELYSHSADTGANFDAMDVTNAAFEPSNAAVVAMYYNQTLHFFRDVVPPVPRGGGSGGGGRNVAECTSKGGIMARKGTACCPKHCESCGGYDCQARTGGGAECCRGEVEANGRNCSTDPPPCNV